MLKISNPEKEYKNLEKKEPQKAAELAFVIAMLAKKAGDKKKAVQYGKKSIKLLDSLNGQTMVECATQYDVVNGIGLPEFIHSEVVRRNLSPLKL